MPLEYRECFGLPPKNSALAAAITKGDCPFVGGKCTKTIARTVLSGACTLAANEDIEPVICCPKRLYANKYQVLQDTSKAAFGPSAKLVRHGEKIPKGSFVIPLGQGQGHEVRVPYSENEGSSKFSVDWILALTNGSGVLEEFVAVEVQTIDTTGNYHQQFLDIAIDVGINPTFQPSQNSSSNFNWENVNKRILPQLITKGHILRREPLCKKGLFFICPKQVKERITMRVGELPEYPMQTGSITFMGYRLDESTKTSPAPLVLDTIHTTTTEQLSTAFASPKTLPVAGVYEEAIKDALSERLENNL